MLLPWKQFRPSATHGTVYQLSFTYRLAGRVRRRSVHASESTAKRAWVASARLPVMKKVLLLTPAVVILREVLQEDVLLMRGST